MNVERKPITFEASARLQRLIGRDLIPNDEMAIVELVKNSYDSGARRVHILIRPESSKNPGLIRISDDGEGMSEADIGRLFMFAGYSERPEQTKFASRMPTGEKGIGRFASDKLGATLEVFTSKAGARGIHLSIDWRAFDVKSRKRFSDISAFYTLTDVSAVVRATTGTVLEIGRLRSAWDQTKIEHLKTWLSDLVNPFAKPDDFAIELEIDGTKHAFVKIDPSPPTGDLAMEITISRDRVRRVIRQRDQKSPIVDESAGSSADLAPLRGLRAQFVHFDRRPKKDETNGLAAGVRVYRDGFRIEPFGSRTADWLGVSEHRAKRAGHAHVVPSRLFGFVEISRKTNPDLGDTTSRQALLDTAAARNLVTVLREGLSSLADVLRSRKEPRWKENRRRRQAELEQARLHTLGEFAAGLAHELRQPLQSIRSEADNIRRKLELLQLTDEDIVQSQEAIDRGIVRIDRNISLVSNLSNGNLTDVAACDLAATLRNDLDVFANQCSPLGINVSFDGPDQQRAKVNELLVSIVIMNFLRNSMESIDTSGGSSITVRLTRQGALHHIDVEDDGGGVPDEVVPHLFKKFATKKTAGMGVGLYNCKMFVESHGGSIGFEPRRPGAHFWIDLPDG
jgi:signal transduction histidine kinase